VLNVITKILALNRFDAKAHFPKMIGMPSFWFGNFGAQPIRPFVFLSEQTNHHWFLLVSIGYMQRSSTVKLREKEKTML
jgi:hypothetical protein